MSNLAEQVLRRRTFAIISHPDAGKTTLTEKLLLFGGAIQLAGTVKARGAARRARSDWMKVEQERGISVTASAMTFEHEGRVFNLLDTPGHEDFSEDTYRTLTAVDSAIMVIDAAKGIESQTRKLFEVCRLRDVPILTFINKLDRDSRDPFELLDEIEQSLALDVSPASWPIGCGRQFLGCYDVLRERLLLMGRSVERLDDAVAECSGLGDATLDELLPAAAVARLREEVEMAQALCPAFSLQAYREGHLTPVFFGSALNSFGVRELLDGLARYAPPPRPQTAEARSVDPTEPATTGFVFKIQANMDPKHRDRVAFVRLASGHFRRGQKLLHVRSGSTLAVHNPILFLAKDRGLAEEAIAGDIIGIPNHGKLRLGDTLTEGEPLKFTGVPSFAPEVLRTANLKDPMRAKHLGRALHQLAEEGAAQVLKPLLGSSFIVGVVGALQFDILADRLRTEYDIDIGFEHASAYATRWVQADSQQAIKDFTAGNRAALATDHTGTLVFLARNAWHLETTEKEAKGIRFLKTRQEF